MVDVLDEATGRPYGHLTPAHGAPLVVTHWTRSDPWLAALVRAVTDTHRRSA